MLTEAMQYLRDLALKADAQTVEKSGTVFSFVPMHPVRDKVPDPPLLRVRTLEAVVDYLTSNRDKLDPETCLVHIAAPDTVEVLSKLFGDCHQRHAYLRADTPTPHLKLDAYLPVEEQIIQLLQHFTDAGSRADVLKLLGNVETETVATERDDGVTQRVAARTGVVGVEDVKVANPVHLAPYRTFREITQPTSAFVLRLKKQGPATQAMLAEADGWAWHLNAVASIREWLKNRLTGWEILG